MKANPLFKNKAPEFWAIVKMVSETCGYSERNRKDGRRMKTYFPEDVLKAHQKMNIPTELCFDNNNSPTEICKNALEYLNYRADILEDVVKGNLLNREIAKEKYEELKEKFPESSVKVQMNKQKGDKRHPSYLVNMVNLIAESKIGNGSFDDDPMKMGIISNEKGPLRVLCRRMDGAVPSVNQPKILWEVKEYYGTKTFGSRIADGVYETMLVGEELKSIENSLDLKIDHILFVDDYFTWWELGRSYLCRLLDILNMGYADYIFFGKEVVTEWPQYLDEKITK